MDLDPLEWQPGLFYASKDWVKSQKDNLRIQKRTSYYDNPYERSRKYGETQLPPLQGYITGELSELDTVLRLILDTNTIQKINREAIFDPRMTSLGIASAHAELHDRLSTFMLAEGYSTSLKHSLCVPPESIIP